MPNLGFGEIVVILLVALIVFGPRRLPEIGRTVGKSVREFRRATSNLRAELEEDLDEDDLAPPTRRSTWQRRGDAASGDRTARRTEIAPDAPEIPLDDAGSATGSDRGADEGAD